MRFVQDDDAHWYLLPDEELDGFYEWLADEFWETYEGEFDTSKYDDYRSYDPGYYSVTINE